MTFSQSGNFMDLFYDNDSPAMWQSIHNQVDDSLFPDMAAQIDQQAEVEEKIVEIVQQPNPRSSTVGDLIPKIIKQTRKGQKIKKSKKGNDDKPFSDYRKNICGYVTKKALRQFLNQTYKTVVEEMCKKQHITYESARSFYVPKLQRITGPSHIPGLFQYTTKEQMVIPKVFLTFFKWFLKFRYLRHLVCEGKMEQKKAYIEYKNRELLPMIAQIESEMNNDYQNLSTIMAHEGSSAEI